MNDQEAKVTEDNTATQKTITRYVTDATAATKAADVKTVLNDDAQGYQHGLLPSTWLVRFPTLARIT